MATVIATYDLSEGWTEVKKVALANGFYEYIEIERGGASKAPNTVLFYDDKPPEWVFDLFIRVVARASVNLGLVIDVRKLYCVTTLSDGYIRSDERRP